MRVGVYRRLQEFYRYAVRTRRLPSLEGIWGTLSCQIETKFVQGFRLCLQSSFRMGPKESVHDDLQPI